MPLVHFVWFKTTLRKTFWPYMKILSKITSLLLPASMIPLFHILFTSLLHFLPSFVLFRSFFFYFIHLYFIVFCFISFPSASFRYISFSFRFISHHIASFRILVGPKQITHTVATRHSMALNLLCISWPRNTVFR